MGFYVDLVRRPQAGEFLENKTPAVFWGLYVFAGFAIACMWGAAYSVLGELARKGSTFDRFVLFTTAMSIPAYVLVGVKLAFVRKRILIHDEEIVSGFCFGDRPLWSHRVARHEVRGIELTNHRPASNLAPRQHDDRQYYIRGHWRVVLVLDSGKRLFLDKHTERGALEPLHAELTAWCHQLQA